MAEITRKLTGILVDKFSLLSPVQRILAAFQLFAARSEYMPRGNMTTVVVQLFQNGQTIGWL